MKLETVTFLLVFTAMLNINEEVKRLLSDISITFDKVTGFLLCRVADANGGACSAAL